MKVSYEWLKEFVACELKPQELATALTMSGLEVEEIESVGKDVVFTFGVTPNRADCLSVVGIAREIAAVTASKLLPRKEPVSKGNGAIVAELTVKLSAPEAAPRYAARIIHGVKVASSPTWLVKRLEASGLRSINNVVDATNYAMLETGQPFHAFDAARLRGKKLLIQFASSGDTFTTLDGVERKLLKEDLLICDAQGPVALAGIMGGENSEVRNATVDLILESAFFEPRGVRRTSKRFGLSSESSRRFERGVDPNGTLKALHRLTELIVQVSGGTPSADWIDLYSKVVVPREVVLSVAEVERVIGKRISMSQMTTSLKRLGCITLHESVANAAFSIPTFRPDLEREIDLIEEVVRLHGYDHVEEELPRFQMTPCEKPLYATARKRGRAFLEAHGFHEALLLGFSAASPEFGIPGDPVRLANPLSQECSTMRSTLLSGLLEGARLNQSRQRTDVRLFAVQRIYWSEKGEIFERFAISGLMQGASSPGSWDRSKEEVDFHDVKGMVQQLAATLGVERLRFSSQYLPKLFHPNASQSVFIGKEHEGWVGKLSPELEEHYEFRSPTFLFELDLESCAKSSRERMHVYHELSRFPFVERDISLLLDESLTMERVEAVIRAAEKGLIQEIRVFDVYTGKGVPPGKKSIAFTIRYAASDRTLTDDEVTKSHQNVISRLLKELSAELRSEKRPST